MSADQIKPLGNHVLIKRKEACLSKGNILLPDSAQEKPREGKVIAIGSGKRDEKGNFEPMSVKPGDEVLFSSYAGTEVKMDDDGEYLLMAEDDILGILVTT